METKTSERDQLAVQMGNLEERFTNVQERLSHVEGQLANVEEVFERLVDKIETEIEKRLQQKLVIIIPQLEELLASRQASCAPSNPVDRFPPAQAPSLPAIASSSKPSLNVEDSASTSAAGLPAQPIQSFPSTSRDSPTSLLEAVRKADLSAVHSFVSSGGNVNAQDTFGNTPLHVAANNGSTNIANVLLAHGAALDLCGQQGRTALHYAAANGFSQMVARLLAARATVDPRDAQGFTPLALAARGGHVASVQILADMGASTESAAEDGETPLLTAVKNQRRGVVQMLVKKGASPTTKNPKGESPLFFASAVGYEDMLREMLQGVENMEREEVERSLKVASSARAVWIFAEAAEDLVIGQAGRDAFFVSVCEGRHEALRGFLQLGINPNTMNEFGFAGLHLAASNGHNECVRELLAAGADVNIMNASGETPLHLAAMYGKKNCIVGLIEGGADMSIRLYNSFHSPLPVDYANQYKRTDCVLELLKRMEQVNAQKGSSRP
ncbi:hypothetical protein R5R35_006560 [Gryllus longicercus]|uniref:Ankyrin repeat protein n=1 Tax=Gryllus longicercus TaxID=2509291 RepID=A0AAN9VB62_9ORTH